MEKIKRFVKDKNLYIFMLVTLLFYGAFCLVQYAPDTYSVFTNSIRETVTHFFSCGRFITGLFIGISMKIFGNIGTYYFSYTIAIICTIISLYKLNNLLLKYINSKLITVIISTLVIINPFSIELYMYIEKGIMVLSLLFCVMATEQIESFLLKKRKKELILSLLFMFLANCSYQGTVGFFVCLASIYIIKYSKNIGQFVKNNIIVALIYGIPAMLNFALIKILYTNDRVSGNIIITESLTKLIDGTKRMIINTYDILPKGLFLCAIILNLIFIIYKLYKTKDKKINKVVNFLGAIYIIFVAWIVTIVPQMLQDTASIWFVARSSYPMATAFGVLLLYIFLNFENSKSEKKCIIILSVIFLIIEFVSFEKLIIGNFIGNYLDKQEAQQILEHIEEYEKSNNTIVDTISIYTDSATKYVYDGILASGDMNIRALSTSWCIEPILKLYSGRNFDVMENDSQLKDEFQQYNWNQFDEKQLIFNQNVLHLCLY